MDPARTVERALVLEILEDAGWAPTHGLTQPWRFHVFTDGGRTRLAEGLQSLYDELTPVDTRKEDKREKLGVVPRLAPVAIAVFAYVQPGGKISELDELCATAAAVQNLALSAHEHGLGSFWATPPVAVSPAFAAWMGLDASHKSLGLVYLGYPLEGKTPKAPSRDPIAEHVVFHDA